LVVKLLHGRIVLTGVEAVSKPPARRCAADEGRGQGVTTSSIVLKYGEEERRRPAAFRRKQRPREVLKQLLVLVGMVGPDIYHNTGPIVKRACVEQTFAQITSHRASKNAIEPQRTQRPQRENPKNQTSINSTSALFPDSSLRSLRFNLLLTRAQTALFLAIVLLLSAHAFAEIDPNQFRADLSAIAQYPSRVIGSPGYYSAGQYLQTEIAKLPNIALKKQEYSVLVPVTKFATLESPGRVDPVYPFWPAQVRVSSTPPEGIRGKLIYSGDCRYAEMKPASLLGQIAVIEASAGERWTEPFYDGARAEIVLGSPGTTWADLKDHDLRIPVNFPRFFVPPGALADDLRAGKISQATVKASVQWQQKTATNYFALVRPLKNNPGRAALMFSVPLDSTSLVPDLSPGASQAVQTAAGLALVRELSKKPWNRPVVVFFSGADGIQFLGTRNMFFALGVPPITWTEEIQSLDDQIRDVQRDLTRAQQLQPRPQDISITADRDLIHRINEAIDFDLVTTQDQLFRLRSQPAQTPEDAQTIQTLVERQIALNRLKAGFQSQPSLLATPDVIDTARDFLTRAIARLGGQADHQGLLQQYQSRESELTQRIDLYHWLADAEGRARDPDIHETGSRLIELLVGLDLSDHGSRAGPLFFGYFQRATGIGNFALFKDWFTPLLPDAAGRPSEIAWWKKIENAIDLQPLDQTRAATSYLAGPLPIASELSPVWATPGLSMITLDDLRLRRDTPADALASIDVRPILPQLSAVTELFSHAWNDPKFRGPTEMKRLDADLTGQVVSAAPGRPVPDLPCDGYLATYYYITSLGGEKKIPPIGSMPWTLGMRRGEVQSTDSQGNYRFEGLPRLRCDRPEGPTRALNDMEVFAVEAYRVDPDSGAITAATDLGSQSEDISWSADIKSDILPIRSVPFNCQEFSLVGLYDPRFLQTLNEVLPLDARRNAEPQRFNMLLFNRMLAGFVEPGTRNDLLIRFGQIGNRLVLLNMPPRGVGQPALEARGYTPEELNQIGPLALATSRDFYRLDDRRLDDYRKAGVSSDLIDRLHKDAGDQLQAAERSLQNDDAVSLIRQSTGTWAAEARIYEAAQDMARDVVRGAIFLLILCVPFSFCMERLLVASPNVYKQIAGIAVIFLIMSLLLWSFHPAFKISTSPFIIILSFAIISMACLVIFVVYGKFDTELKRLRSGRGNAEGTSFASAGVLTSAILLGIANMRKRRFRTVLTSATVVLITFAVLWFTSTSRFLGTTTISTGVASSHPGIMLRQRGYRPMPQLAADQLRAILADPALNLSNPRVVERWWAVSASDPKEEYNLSASAQPGQPPRTVGIEAVLGLTPGESELSKIADVIGPEKFARLETGQQNIVYLSAPIARDLGVREGQHIRLGGIDLEIAGIFDPLAFDRRVTMLSGESLAPLSYAVGEMDTGGQDMDDTTPDAINLDNDSAASEAGTVYEHLSASDFVIVPAPVCQKLLYGSLRTVGFRLQNQQQVQAVSEELSRRLSLATYAGYDDGVRLVVAGNLSSVSGFSQIAVPLLLAGLIIFNTMMGSIAERRREIHVYTSLGLAPLHVGGLFLAEAMTYGLVGTVFGYILGQGIGTLMLKLGWLGTVTLNYSGTSAILTMGLILLVVLLSAIIPARLASKIAAPSIDRTWKVPQPHDGQIRAELPFTINRTAADGALAYLAEYFESHREGSIGKFSSDKIEPFWTDEPASGAASRGLKTTVWLTPYDVGVRQRVTLRIHTGAHPDIYEVEVLLQRLSGDDGNWHRMNKTFLTELRKQFLQWRSLVPAQMLKYVQQSKQLFDRSMA
jgi:ABC-type lipoprotein release transport system permease subunit